MLIRRYKYLARFGLMHMVATNIVVWFGAIVKETLREIRHNNWYILVNASKNDVISGKLNANVHCLSISLE